MNPSATKVKEEMEAKGLFPSTCILCNGDCAHCSVASKALKEDKK